MINFEELFLTIPFGNTWHIFSKKDNRSLCGRAAMLIKSPDKCESVSSTTKWTKGQDCKACFRKAGLLEKVNDAVLGEERK